MREKFAIFVLLFLTLMVGITLRIHNLSNVSMRSPDEEIYIYQAKTIVQQGTREGIRSLVREYNMDEKHWIFPSPARIGYLWLLSTVMKIVNSTDMKIGMYISCFFSIISLLLLIVMGLRFFNQWITLYALLFMSVSPMALAISRRVWQDALLGCLGLLLIYFCCEITRATNRIIWYALFIVVGSLCILIKEYGAIIYALCMVWLLWVLLIKERSFLKGIIFIVFSVLGAGTIIFTLTRLIGGFPALLKILGHVKEGLLANTYAIEYQSGPWYHFLQGFWIMSPVNTLFSIIGIGGVFLFSRPRRKIKPLPIDKNSNAVFGIIFFMIAFITVIIAAPYCQNLRYVSPLYGPFYLMGGLGLWYIILFAKTRLNNFPFSITIVGIVIVIIFAAVDDYYNFKKLFLKTGLMDAPIRLLREP